MLHNNQEISRGSTNARRTATASAPGGHLWLVTRVIRCPTMATVPPATTDEDDPAIPPSTRHMLEPYDQNAQVYLPMKQQKALLTTDRHARATIDKVQHVLPILRFLETAVSLRTTNKTMTCHKQQKPM